MFNAQLKAARAGAHLKRLQAETARFVGAKDVCSVSEYDNLEKGLHVFRVELVQPYKRAAAFRDDPLWQLNELCNLDKHCTLAISSNSVNLRTSGPSIDIVQRYIDDAF